MPSAYTDNQLSYLPATKIAQLIRDKAITSLEITQIYLSRIKQYNLTLNAIVISIEQDALERAKAADKAISEGKNWGVLHGVPMTIKESFNIKGYKTTVNFKRIKNYVAEANAVVVDKLYNAGAIILGKTNVPTLLSDHQTHGPLYPRANNPFDLTRTTGGSTGGGACAVAAGLSSLEIGSDIGGSVRIPAHYCGIFSLKTTENAISGIGHIPPLPKAKATFKMMSAYGPLARSIEDLELAFELLKEVTIKNEKGEKSAWKKGSNKKIADYSLAWTTSINEVNAGKETSQLFDDLVEKLSPIIKKINRSFPKIDVGKAEENWGNIFGYLAGQDLSWFMRQMVKLQQGYSYATRPKGKYIANGIGVKESKLAEFLKLRQQNIEVFHNFFKEYDFLLCPVAAGPAFKHCKTGDTIPLDGKKLPYWDMGLTFVFIPNVLGLPSMIVPLGKSSSGLPIGLQIIGPYCSESELLNFGKQLMPYIQGFQAPSGYEL